MKQKWMLSLLITVMVFGTSGCESLIREDAKKTQIVDKTEEQEQEEATPTPVPATPTPLPTVTPAPRAFGAKSETAKALYFTNSTDKNLRGIYIKSSYSEEWGENYVPMEASVRKSEKVQLFYEPQESSYYDIKIVNADTQYVIYSVNLADMDQTSLRQQDSEYYLSYKSLSDGEDKDTRDYYYSDYDSYYDSSYDSEYTYQEETYYSEDYYDSSYDSSYDSYYDNNYDSDYDSSYDNSYDSYYDNGYGDEESYY